MNSPRETCVVPEKPLMISTSEEKELNQLALAAWRALGGVVEMIRDSPASNRSVANSAAKFPDGLTMPPVMRVDTVRTEAGPRIVEIDPITAISLGETVALTEIWSEQGYAVPGGVLDVIRQSLPVDEKKIALTIPSVKSEYESELNFLIGSLAEAGVEYDKNATQLSAFNDVASVRRGINKNGWDKERNPLWGSLVGLADKTNLGMLVSGDKIDFPKYLPREYTREDMPDLREDAVIIAKPLKGSGSVGVVATTSNGALRLPDGYMFQEKFEVLSDDFGIGGEWASRVSIYAGRYGLMGAQVTARRKNENFTNVHGQSDAVQTTLAVE